MNLKIYQVDAFTSSVFGGNPAAVCPLENWLATETMQSIAAENNLSETAFYVHEGASFHIRWFTPTTEVDLCGHATLATAFVEFNLLGHQDEIIHFTSKSGDLMVKKQDKVLTLDFPADVISKVAVTDQITLSIRKTPVEAYRGSSDVLVVLEKEQDVQDLDPDFLKMSEIDARGVIVTAPGDESDFVSRFFAPQSGIDEDPVTGSAHTSLIPYWSERLNKTELSARQISTRGGELFCKSLGKRVEIAGNAVLYMEGNIYIEE